MANTAGLDFLQLANARNVGETGLDFCEVRNANGRSPPSEETLVDEPPAVKPITIVGEIRVVDGAHVHGIDGFRPQRGHDISWYIVGVSTIEKLAPIDRVTQRRHVARKGHTRSHVAPQGAARMDSHFAIADVG